MPQGCRFRAVRCRWLSGRVSLKLRAGVAQRPIFAISKEDYDKWRYHYPDLDSSSLRQKVGPSQGLSDLLTDALKSSDDKE